MINYTRFNFVHVPKCGGTSIRLLLDKTAEQNDIPIEERYIVGSNGISNDKHITQLSQEEIHNLDHNKIKIIAGHHKYEEVENRLNLARKQTFQYTILRDPIDRFISHYNFFHYKLNYHNCQGIKLTELEPERLSKYIKLYENIHIRFIANLKYPKLFNQKNQFKVAWYNLIHEFSCFGILELPEISQQLLRQKAPSWLTFYEEMPKSNSNNIEYELPDNIINQIESSNLLDIKFYNLAKDHMLKQL